jgi:tRNA pseudouridine38-40 synthase
MRIALAVEYDGSGFRGWQKQPGGGTVQDALQDALQQFAGVPGACGLRRSDRCRRACHRAGGAFRHHHRALNVRLGAWSNTFLPPAVAVRWAQVVADNFHARSSAYSRRYRYLLLNRPHRPGAWQGGWVGIIIRSICRAMQSAAGYLLGERDFSAFRAAECQASSPVKIMRRADIGRVLAIS